MAIRQVTDNYFKVILVQAALTNAQQDAVASILELDPLPPNAYELLKAELIRLHEKTSWDRMKELFAMPPLGAQRPTELLAAMKNLRPADPELWFRYQYFSRLPADTQRQLAEHQGTVEELAARADELHQKAPLAAAAAPIAAATTDNPVAAALPQQPKGRFNRHPKRKRSGDAAGGGGPARKRRPEGTPWLDAGLCYYHWHWGAKAEKCEPPCYRKLGN